ncbi:uncharacterized protein EV422DRAFT_570371 [Fimicolochytrium jonesii]|uniref:uncharacterized protein n=1 Tax=Fimicolochytrium jonesii TaxID=1396493 RepID=UPI0022FDFA26|nr:uncharacterized protein EV422DRAFT_570371 [Fimicolochytrium jonesii]KAI8817627.1 hypothetical protein EV422DRAFT_570371 [Fimicolochytrium jonesii]
MVYINLEQAPSPDNIAPYSRFFLSRRIHYRRGCKPAWGQSRSRAVKRYFQTFVAGFMLLSITLLTVKSVIFGRLRWRRHNPPPPFGDWDRSDIPSPHLSTVLLVVTQPISSKEQRKLDDVITDTERLAKLSGKGKTSIISVNIPRQEAEQRYPHLKDNVTDYGYAYTDAVIDRLVHAEAHPKSSTLPACEYILFTNGDNLYSSRLGKLVIPLMRNKVDLIGFDFLSGHATPDTEHDPENGVFDDGTLRHIPVNFKTNGIDLGSSIHRFSVIRDGNLRFLNLSNVHPGLDADTAMERLSMADGTFVEKMAAVSDSAARVRQILLMHQ